MADTPLQATLQPGTVYTINTQAGPINVTLVPGGGGGAVTSVFGRTGAVVAQAGDYDNSQVTNVSAVAGATTAAALNTLNTGKVSTARLINTTAPLGGGGSLAADLTLTVATVSNASSGVVPSVGAAGTALISTGSAAGWGVDFAAQTLTTTGGYLSNASGGFFRAGLAPGSGAGSAAATGSLRLPNGNFVGFIAARNAADNADVFILGYSSTSSTVQFGTSSSGNPSIATTDIAALTTVRNRIGSSGTVIFQMTATAISVGSTVTSFSFDGLPTVSIQQLGATGAGKTLSVNAQGGTTSGGDLSLFGGPAGAAGQPGGGVNVVPGKGTGDAGNVNMLAASVPGYNAMKRGLFFANSEAPPNANPTGGAYMYGASGSGLALSPTGTYTTLWAN